MTTGETVRYEVADQVATIVIDRAGAMNAIDPETEAALGVCWQRAAADDAVRAVVLTGAGQKAFCAGADLKKTMPPAASYAVTAFSGEGDHNFLGGMDMDKPVICAVNGFALGGGLELALACDIRICAPHARFGLPEVKAGTIPGAGGTQRLPRMIGGSDAMLMLLTGNPVDASHALRLGLVSRIVDADRLLDDAQAIGRAIAANAPLSVRAIKHLVRTGASMPLAEALRYERTVWGVLRNTEDRVEGRRAFAEKRPPDYVGR